MTMQYSTWTGVTYDIMRVARYVRCVIIYSGHYNASFLQDPGEQFERGLFLGTRVAERDFFLHQAAPGMRVVSSPIHSQADIAPKACVRRRAILSVMANPNCPDKESAERAVNEVWESCFNDTRPFDEVSQTLLVCSPIFTKVSRYIRLYISCATCGTIILSGLHAATAAQQGPYEWSSALQSTVSFLKGKLAIMVSGTTV